MRRLTRAAHFSSHECSPLGAKSAKELDGDRVNPALHNANDPGDLGALAMNLQRIRCLPRRAWDNAEACRFIPAGRNILDDLALIRHVGSKPASK
jgi:hypothetical protein